MEKQAIKQTDKPEKKQTECYFISVESRKGGVGKTTAALNLARMLVKSGQYEVVLLDFDIAGTEIALSEDSLTGLIIWKKYINMVENPFQKIDLKPEQNKINLVTLFERYMTGESIPEIKWEDDTNEKNTLPIFLTRGKINIISSILNRGGKGENHSYGPAVLFDEMHSEWFLAMIKEIITGTRKLELNGKNLLVIIDNAPGYSGLEPAVEEWLTDIGPRYGKFLFVCTLDTQDFIGCCHSIQAIYDLYCKNWEISRRLLSDKDEPGKEDGIDFSNSREKRFFYRLIESTPAKEKCKNCETITPVRKVSQACPGDDFCFYRQSANNGAFGEQFKKEPKRFMGLVINKIPGGIFAQKEQFNAKEILEKNGFAKDEYGGVFNLLSEKNLIPFLDDLSYQYMDSTIASMHEPKTGFSPTNLWHILKASKETFDRSWKDYENTRENHEGEIYLKKLIKIEYEYDKRFNDFHDRLTLSQNNYLTIFWDEEFSIFSSKKTFLQLFIGLLQRNDQNMVDAHSIKIQNHDPKYLNKEAAEILMKLLTIKEKIQFQVSGNEAKIPRELIKRLKIIEMLSFDMALLNESRSMEDKVHALIIILYAMHYIYVGNSIESGERDIEKYLRETASCQDQSPRNSQLEAAAGETLSKTIFLREIELLNLKNKSNQLVRLYREFIKTATRLLDLDRDFEFLCECCRLILVKPELAFIIKELAEEVIVKKTKPQKAGLEELDKQWDVELSISDSVVLKNINDFETTLENILKEARWGILA